MDFSKYTLPKAVRFVRRKTCKAVFGWTPEQIASLNNEVEHHRKVIDFLAEGSHNPWLYANRAERMDATVDVFDAVRRSFHLGRYEFACQYVRDKSVADIACGTGYGAGILRRNGGACRVVGVDIDAKAVEYATAKHGDEAIEFLCAPGDETPLDDDSVDVVTSFETVEHVPCDRKLLREFHRVLKPGGMLVISTPNSWPVDFAIHHVREYTLATFEETLAESFEVIEMHNQNSGTPWQYNHRQEAGIRPTTPENRDTAECYIAVCRAKA